jgi:hypothetical protein
MPVTLSPIPQKSPMADKEQTIAVDWLRWFRDVTTYVLRLLNRYDNTKSNIASLTAGNVVVANTNVKASSYIRLTRQTLGGTPGHLSVVPNVGVGFTINSSSALDTSTVFYEIVEAF